MMKLRSSSMLAGLAVAMIGCDGQAPSDYQGTVLASIHGTVANTSDNDLPGAEMALISYGRTGEHGSELDFGSIASLDQITRVPVTGAFPASFRLDLYSPPPARDMHLILTGGDVAKTMYSWSVQVMAAIQPASPDRPVKASDCLLSATTQELILYFDRDVPPDAPAPYSGVHCTSPQPTAASSSVDAGAHPPCNPVPDVTAAQFFGGSLAKGYHMVRLRGLTTPPGEWQVARPTGFDEIADGFDHDLHIDIDRATGPDCRAPRVYPYDGGVP